MWPDAAVQTMVNTGRPGTLLAMVGPSGSGKDTLIDWLRQRLVQDRSILFVRRTVTRPADSVGEEHDMMSDEEFTAAEAAGRFCLTWKAHGLRYGLPQALCNHLEEGGVAVVNGSRKALPLLCETFTKVVVAHLTVDREILASRLAVRGRETPSEIEARLARSTLNFECSCPTIAIDNSGPIEAAGNALLKLIAEFSDLNETA